MTSDKVCANEKEGRNAEKGSQKEDEFEDITSSNLLLNVYLCCI